MSDLRKAAEMALEALKLWGNAGEAPTWYGRHERIDAINALRQALAQPEQGNNSPNCPNTEPNTSFVDAVNMTQKRVDETVKGEHKPYGYVWTSLRDGMEVRFSRMPPNKFYNPQDTKPVYTAPPKRAWVGYTNEDREKIVPMLVQSLRSHDDKTLAGLLNAILIDVEQQLKEKNNG